MSNRRRFLILVVGVLLILSGVFTATLGPTYATIYSTTTNTSYSTLTTITLCHSATGVSVICSTSGSLVYIGTISYSTVTATNQTIMTSQTPMYTRSYLGILIAITGASLSIVSILLVRRRSGAA